MTNSIKIEDSLSIESYTVGNDTLFLCKITAHKWIVANGNGGILFTSKTKKAAVVELGTLRKAAVTASKKASKKPATKSGKSAKAASKPAAKGAKGNKPTVKTNKNVNKFTFGSKIDAATVVSYAGEIWGDTLTLSNVEFVDSHYWKGTVANQDGATVDKVRLDYLCNFVRVPTALKSDAVVAVQLKALGQ